jgi:protein-tyrosine phosphatase
MNKIIDGVYLGNLQAAQNLPALKSSCITHILQVANGIQPMFPKQFTYKVIDVPDLHHANLQRHFPAAISFIKQGIQAGGVLVHCHAGVSRSSSIVIAYLMQEHRMTFQEALAFASLRRPVIFPNMGFQK